MSDPDVVMIALARHDAWLWAESADRPLFSRRRRLEEACRAALYPAEISDGPTSSGLSERSAVAPLPRRAEGGAPDADAGAPSKTERNQP